jgi:hypothetical protein
LAFHFSLSLHPNCRNWSPNYSVLVFNVIYTYYMKELFHLATLLSAFGNPVFHLLLQPLCNRPTTITLPGLDKEEEICANLTRQDICNACLGHKDLATISACPPARHKITLTFHADFKCVYKPCFPE